MIWLLKAGDLDLISQFVSKNRIKIKDQYFFDSNNRHNRINGL